MANVSDQLTRPENHNQAVDYVLALLQEDAATLDAIIPKVETYIKEFGEIECPDCHEPMKVKLQRMLGILQLSQEGHVDIPEVLEVMKLFVGHDFKGHLMIVTISIKR